MGSFGASTSGLSTSVEIIFQARVGPSFTSDIAVDDISVVPGVCRSPTKSTVTTTAATTTTVAAPITTTTLATTTTAKATTTTTTTPKPTTTTRRTTTTAKPT